MDYIFLNIGVICWPPVGRGVCVWGVGGGDSVAVRKGSLQIVGCEESRLG